MVIAVEDFSEMFLSEYFIRIINFHFIIATKDQNGNLFHINDVVFNCK